jgi:hypothetical protein
MAANRYRQDRCRWDRRGQEPLLEEMLADPVVKLVLRRDGLTRDDVIGVMREARRHIGCRERRAVA